MASVRKFTFDVDFGAPDSPARPQPDAPAAEESVAEAPAAAAEPVAEEPQGPPLIYSEEDLEIAREEAYIAGHTAALEEATTANDRAVADAMTRIAEGLAALPPEIARAGEEIGDLASRVAVEVVRKLLPHTADDYAAREIEALVRGLLPSLIGQPRLTVRVHPRMVDVLRPRLADLAERAGFEGKVLVVKGDDMTPADASVEWTEGGAERNTSRLWNAIDALLDANIPRFSRAEALAVPADDADAPPPPEPEDIWPDIDPPAWYTPPPPRTRAAPDPDIGPDRAPTAEPEPDQTTAARPESRVPEE